MNTHAFAPEPHLPAGAALFSPGTPVTSRPRRAGSVALVRAALLRAAQDTLDLQGFTQVIAPLVTSLAGACGDPATLMQVDIRGRQAYLRQTYQLHLEPLMRELGRVYSVGRSFRAEPRADERHLTEFTLIEGEAAEMGLPAMMDLMEGLITNMLRAAAEKQPQALAALGVDPAAMRADRRPFARMTYDEAVLALRRAGYFIEWGEDLSNSHETALCDMSGGPLFVTHYPSELRFFTMKASATDPRVVECCDLLLPGVGEVMGASETETDPALLERKMLSSRGVRQILDLGGSADDYTWYIEMHKTESKRQSGFGMGFERVIRYACGLSSVAETVV